MDYLSKIIGDIECHDVEGIRDCFDHGVDPNAIFRGEPLIYELTSEYARGPKFRESVRAFVENGLHFEDKLLLAVLLDDSDALRILIEREPEFVYRKYSLRCAYTPLFEASLLHICAEFNHLSSARVLVNAGANIDEPAG